MLDFKAPIAPGKSAAGFEIGQQLSSVLAQLENVRWVTSALNVQELSRNTGIVAHRGKSNARAGATITVGPDIIRLSFSKDERLACIWVLNDFTGACMGLSYTGSYNGVGIGDPLSQLTERETFEYDSGDEMYYRVDLDGKYLPGLAVIALEADTTEHGSIAIDGFCIQDWTIFNTPAE